MKRSTHHYLAALLAGLFGLFLTYTSLTGSDFVRGLYGPPDASHWGDFAALNPNRVWNYNWGGNASLNAYLEACSTNGIKAFLRLDTQYSAEFDTFYMEYYSCGQHEFYEAELDLDEAEQHLDGYYFFWHRDSLNDPERGAIDLHYPTEPPEAASWKCTHATDDAGLMLNGPRETVYPDQRLVWNNQIVWPETAGTRDFKSIFRVMADLSQLSSLNDAICHLQVYRSSTLIADTICTGNSFAGVSFPNWKTFDLNYQLTGRNYAVYYKIQWYDNCDFWVDNVEFMDLLRAKHLFAKDANGSYLYRQRAVDSIYAQCSRIENAHPGALAGWKQSDEPIRSSFLAHGVVNDSMRNKLQFPTTTPLDQSWWSARPVLMVLMGKVPIIETDIYPFREQDTTGTHFLGSQVELDTLATKLERTYQACGDTLPFYYTAQAQEWPDVQRVPMPAEIFAETYMALAHGANGITFYKYTSGPPYGGASAPDSAWGLVNSFGTQPTYAHPYGPPHYLGEKWDAVQLVFSQLDSIGDILDSLDREAAYCVFHSPDYHTPIINIGFWESVPDYIEVGQFDSAGVDYLIVVNRKTEVEAPLHIDIRTTYKDSSGDAMLWDVYTQEKFLSSTGNFKAIPFAAGQGRVLRLSRHQFPESGGAKIWPCDDKHVLADTLLIPSSDSLVIAPETVIYATRNGKLLVQGALACGEQGSAEPVTFKSLEQRTDFRWLGVEINNNCIECHANPRVEKTATFYNSHIQGALTGIKVDPSGPVEIHDCVIDDSCTYGLWGDNAEIDCDSTAINTCFEDRALFVDCDGSIYNCSLDSGSFAGNAIGMELLNTDLIIGRCGFVGNAWGLYCNLGSDPILLHHAVRYPNGGHNTISYNSVVGLFAEHHSYPLLGTNSDSGYNSLIGNGGYAVNNNLQADTIWAKWNYWGGVPRPAMFNGRVSYVPYLSQAPDAFFGGGGLAAKQNQGGICGGPGTGVSLAAYLNALGTQLYLDQNYEAAMDTFGAVLAGFSSNSAAQYALCFIDNCFRRMENPLGAVNYLSNCAVQFAGNALGPQAQLKSIYHLKKAGLGQQAYSMATNPTLLAQLPQSDLEYAMIESGIIKKYYLCNRVSANSIFTQFLSLYPESPLAPIAAMELGVAWEPRGTSGEGAQGGIMVADLPAEFRLYPNHPNPFNASTRLTYDLPMACKVSLKVFNIQGQLVATLVDGFRAAGTQMAVFDGTELSSGLYLIRFAAGDFAATSKMVLLK